MKIVCQILFGQERHDQDDAAAEGVGGGDPRQEASDQADTSGIEKLEGPDGRRLPVHLRTSNQFV